MGIRAVAQNPAYRFVGLFGLYLAIVAIAYPLLTERWIAPVKLMTSVTAQLDYVLLALVSDEATIDGNLVSLGDFGVRIIAECTGIFEVMIFLAAVLAFPTTWAKRAIGMGLGIPLLYAFNVVRILVLIAVGRHWSELFDFMHLYFWQATLILMITSVWLLWIFKVVRHGEPQGPARA